VRPLHPARTAHRTRERAHPPAAAAGDDELVGSDRPQTGIWWLRKRPGVGPRLLAQMVRGEADISHDTFRALPSDRAHDYLRSLLVAVGVLGPVDLRIERMMPWIDKVAADLPAEHAALVRRYAHWHVLREMRKAARDERLTQAGANAARRRIRVAIDFLAFLDTQQATAATATRTSWSATRSTPAGRWTTRSRSSPGSAPRGSTPGCVSPTSRSRHRRSLCPSSSGGPPSSGCCTTTPFAATPASAACSRCCSPSRCPAPSPCAPARSPSASAAPSTSAFHGIPIQMPPLLDDLIREHLTHRGKSLYASRDTGWLFPGGNPGRPLSTENIRAHLAAIGVKPEEGRKATLFQLAAGMPAPVLAELIGITDSTAADWARLATRDWTSYIAARARQPQQASAPNGHAQPGLGP
jgi:hypothetical protein